MESIPKKTAIRWILVLAALLATAAAAGWAGYEIRGFEQKIARDLAKKIESHPPEVAEAGVTISVLRSLRSGKIEPAIDLLEQRLNTLVMELANAPHNAPHDDARKIISKIKEYRSDAGGLGGPGHEEVRQEVEQILKGVKTP